MSSTRKIEGRATSLMGSYEFIEGPEVPPQGNPWKPAVLIIGGKAFTEEEVTNIIERIRSNTYFMEPEQRTQYITEFAAKNGIQLP